MQKSENIHKVPQYVVNMLGRRLTMSSLNCDIIIYD